MDKCMKVVALWQVSSFPTSPVSPHGGAVMRIMMQTFHSTKINLLVRLPKLHYLSQDGKFEIRPFHLHHQRFESPQNLSRVKISDCPCGCLTTWKSHGS